MDNPINPSQSNIQTTTSNFQRLSSDLNHSTAFKPTSSYQHQRPDNLKSLDRKAKKKRGTEQPDDLSPKKPRTKRKEENLNTRPTAPLDVSTSPYCKWLFSSFSNPWQGLKSGDLHSKIQSFPFCNTSNLPQLPTPLNLTTQWRMIGPLSPCHIQQASFSYKPDKWCRNHHSSLDQEM